MSLSEVDGGEESLASEDVGAFEETSVEDVDIVEVEETSSV